MYLHLVGLNQKPIANNVFKKLGLHWWTVPQSAIGNLFVLVTSDPFATQNLSGPFLEKTEH